MLLHVPMIPYMPHKMSPSMFRTVFLIYRMVMNLDACSVSPLVTSPVDDCKSLLRRLGLFGDAFSLPHRRLRGINRCRCTRCFGAVICKVSFAYTCFG